MHLSFFWCYFVFLEDAYIFILLALIFEMSFSPF